MEAEGQAEESAALKAYTKLSQESEVSDASKTTAIKNKNAEVARVNNMIADLGSDRSGNQAELDAVLEYLTKLKSQCEHVPMSFEERAARRKQEINSLQEALRILETETAPAFLQRI